MFWLLILAVVAIALSQMAVYIDWYDPCSGVQGLAKEAINEGQLTYLSTDTPSKLGLAAAATAGKKRVAGIASSTYAIGDNATAWRRCRTKGHSALTPGDQLYLDTVAGGSVNTVPAAGGQCIPCGLVKAADTVEWDIPLVAIAAQAAGNSNANMV